MKGKVLMYDPKIKLHNKFNKDLQYDVLFMQRETLNVTSGLILKNLRMIPPNNSNITNREEDIDTTHHTSRKHLSFYICMIYKY